VRRTGIVALFALLAVFGATRFVDTSPAPSSALAIERPTPSERTEFGFDADGKPMIRMPGDDARPAAEACRREASRKVPPKLVVDAATAIPDFKVKWNQATRKYFKFMASRAGKPHTPEASERAARLKATLQSARATYIAAGQRYDRLAQAYNVARDDCMAHIT